MPSANQPPRSSSLSQPLSHTGSTCRLPRIAPRGWSVRAAVVLLSAGLACIAAETTWRSPIAAAWSPDGERLAVVDATAPALVFVDGATGSVLQEIALQGDATGVCWSDAATCWVAEPGTSSLVRITATAAAIQGRYRLGHAPTALAWSSASGLLLVADRAATAMYLVDPADGSVRGRIPTTGQACTVATHGDLAVVGNLLAVGDARRSDHAAAVDLLGLATPDQRTRIDLPGGSSALRGVAIGPAGRWAYAVHTLGRTQLPTTQLERGWVNTNALSIIDLQDRRRRATVLLDQATRGAADPWSVAVTADGQTLWVSLAGVHELARIDLAGLHAALAGRHPRPETLAPVWQRIAKDPAALDQLTTDLTSLSASGLLERLPLPLNGPRGLAVGSGRLAVTGYFSGSLAICDSADGSLLTHTTIGSQPPADAVRRGEQAFHDARSCFQHWLSCATCHPDGAADGLNWDLPNDGIGNPKNVRSMVLAHRTPPAMASGIRADSDVAVAAGFQFIQFTTVDDRRLADVRAWVASLEPRPSPFLVDGAPDAAARRGRDLFHDKALGCAHCHPAPLFTDLRSHDVGTRHPLDQRDAFDTPTLREVWRTAPYLHDGSAATLLDVLTTANPNDRHGRTSSLTDDQLADLIAYLRSL